MNAQKKGKIKGKDPLGVRYDHKQAHVRKQVPFLEKKVWFLSVYLACLAQWLKGGFWSPSNL